MNTEEWTAYYSRRDPEARQTAATALTGTH